MNPILILLLSILALVSGIAFLAIVLRDRRRYAFHLARVRLREEETRVRFLVCQELHKGLQNLVKNSGYPEGSMNQALLEATCKKIREEALS
jgi:hypothetical protein